MQRIVVGTDFSDGSLAALDWAARLAREAAVPLEVATSWEHPWWAFLPSFVNPTPVPRDEDIEPRLLTQLEDMLSELDLECPEITASVHHGGAAQTLVSIVGKDDLLVVGTRGRGAVADTVLGSVSERCVATAPCPVAVVPETDVDATLPVVVAVDGSENSIAAARWVADTIASLRDVAVASAYGVPLVMGFEAMSQSYEAALELERQSATEVVDEVVEMLTEAGARAWADVEPGDPRTVLAAAEDKASMLVIGARGRGAVTHALLGSVATSLVHHPVCPIVVVPAP